MLSAFFYMLRSCKRYLLILIIATLLAGFTSYKLWRMAQIRGWISGATVRVEQVTQKYVSDGQAYWVSWNDDDIRIPGDHRLNLAYDQWLDIQPGDPIEIVYAGGSSDPNTRDGIYAENGNFIFDGLLLTAEITAVGLILVRLYRRVNGHLASQSAKTSR